MAVQGGSDFSVQEDLPPGYRFKPTDVELLHYLNLKIMNKRISIDDIKDVDIYKYHPHDLCQSWMNGKHEGYFFTSRTKKYLKGGRPDRTTGDGYWKATGGDIIVQSNGQEVGRKKVLVYYEGKSKNNNGTKTNWIMHEFTIHQTKNVARSSTNAIPDDKMLDMCVCRIYYRTSKSSKNKEQETGGNIIPIQETHVRDTNLATTSSYQNSVSALDQSSLQDAYVLYQQATIIDQYPLVQEPVTYMQSNTLPSPQPLVCIPGMQSNDHYQCLTHMNGDVGTSRFAASTSNDNGDFVDLTTPYLSSLFGLLPPTDTRILDSVSGDVPNAQLQYLPIPHGQPIIHMQGDVGGSRINNIADSVEYLDLPSPPTLDWFDPRTYSSNMQFLSENVCVLCWSKFDSDVAGSTLEDRM
ncbi:NAC domain-containing 72-like [Olea europaea subsp. europaea]|uniref:NAC domain-containing 72-like n=1 Tax=Olea europaea subsp. europaea TaxID=158383 RepID=A0A8S0V1U6_OLEEU|nr:NAC domain-containing 72-like [Olea europaea subsp. europaea]